MKQITREFRRTDEYQVVEVQQVHEMGFCKVTVCTSTITGVSAPSTKQSQALFYALFAQHLPHT